MNGIGLVGIVFGIIALVIGVMAYNWKKRNK
jgi:hypothetical protein